MAAKLLGGGLSTVDATTTVVGGPTVVMFGDWFRWRRDDSEFPEVVGVVVDEVGLMGRLLGAEFVSRDEGGDTAKFPEPHPACGGLMWSVGDLELRRTASAEMDADAVVFDVVVNGDDVPNVDVENWFHLYRHQSE